MEKTKKYKLNNNDKKIKLLEKGWGIGYQLPICISGLLLLIFSIAVVLNQYTDMSIISDNIVPIIYAYLIITVFLFLFGTVLFVINFNIQNSVVFQEENNILILYSLNSIPKEEANRAIIGSIAAQHGSLIGTIASTSSIHINKKEKKYSYIEQIISSPRAKYKYYKNCKIVKEAKSYFILNGDFVNDDDSTYNTNFKLSKMYKNIENIKKDLK